MEMLLLFVFAFISSFVITEMTPISEELENQDIMEQSDAELEMKKKSGYEVQSILNLIENAMNEAPKGSRPKQVRFSVVGKRNDEDLAAILRRMEDQLSQGDNGHPLVPVRFSLIGKRSST